MLKRIHATLAVLALAVAVPAAAENWQTVAKGDKISSIEIDKDALQRIHGTSAFRIRLTYPADSLPPWKGDTLVATAILGCDGSVPLSFDHIKYYKAGKEAGGALVSRWPEAAPPLPAEAVAVICALPAPSPATSSGTVNWRSLGAGAGQAVSWDPDSLKSDGSSRSFRMKDANSDGYSVISAVVDCAASTMNIVLMEPYTPGGTQLSSKKNAGMIKIEPGTPGADIQKLVCT